ncbi:MAG: MFS transporter [Neisseriaceae bacterium]
MGNLSMSNVRLRKLFICALAGFSSGMPLFLFLNLLPLWFRSEQIWINHLYNLWGLVPGGWTTFLREEALEVYLRLGANPFIYHGEPAVDLKAIGLLNLLQLPYIFKFLWAPLLDRYNPFGLGRRRGWMLLTQVIILLVTMSYAWLRPSTQMTYVVFLSFLLTFFSATQDVAIDAFRREILSDRELGLGNAISGLTYRFSMLVPGSLALILSDYVNWSVAFIVTGAFMLVGIFMVGISSEPSTEAPLSNNLQMMLWDPLREYINRNGTKHLIYVMIFLVLYKLGDTLAISFANVFCYDMGYSRALIGGIAQYAQVIAFMMGTLIGGVLMFRIGISKALWFFGVVQATSILGYAWLASMGPFEHIGEMEKIYLALVVFYEYLGVGLGSAVFIAFIARESSPHYAATQIAFFTAIAAIPRSFLSSTSGWLVQQYGYYHYFWLCFLLALPGMIALFKVAPWSEERIN